MSGNSSSRPADDQADDMSEVRALGIVDSFASKRVLEPKCQFSSVWDLSTPLEYGVDSTSASRGPLLIPRSNSRFSFVMDYVNGSNGSCVLSISDSTVEDKKSYKFISATPGRQRKIHSIFTFSYNLDERNHL